MLFCLMTTPVCWSTSLLPFMIDYLLFVIKHNWLESYKNSLVSISILKMYRKSQCINMY